MTEPMKKKRINNWTYIKETHYQQSIWKKKQRNNIMCEKKKQTNCKTS